MGFGGRPGGQLVVCLFLLLVWVRPAASQDVPALSGRVVDAADVLSPRTEDALTLRLADWEAESADQIVVLTVPDLQGRTIEGYGIEVARAWGLGQADLDNGAVLILAPNDRQVRIEVGYGLEGTLTDAASSVIIQTRMVPALRAGDYDAAVTEGVIGMIETLRAAPEEAAARRRRAPDRPMAQGEEGVPWPLILLVLFLVLSLWPRRRRRRGRVAYDSDPRMPGALPWIIGPGLGGVGPRGRAPGGLSGGFSGGFGGFGGGGGSFGGGGASGSW